MFTRTNKLLFMIAALACTLSLASIATAQDEAAPPDTRLILDTGDIIMGKLLSSSDDFVSIDHPILGAITLPMSRVRSLTNISPEQARMYEQEPEPPAAQPEPPAQEKTLDLPEESHWKLRFEAGLTGAEGNTERADSRLAFTAKRELENEIFNFIAEYYLSFDGGDRTQNKLHARAHQEWLEPETPWTQWIQADIDIDEFKDYNIRYSATAGLGYRFFDTERTTLTGRAGFGFSYEQGGREELIPEGFLGFDLRHIINDHLTWTAFGEYYPEFRNVGEYRARAGTALEIDLMEDNSLFLHLGIEDEYLSVPGDAKNNDIRYFATLVYEF